MINLWFNSACHFIANQVEKNVVYLNNSLENISEVP